MKKLFLTVLAFLAFSLLAEDRSGRLDDGRAYRIDNEGTQVVDYIAELELQIEELQSKIRSLENEKRYENSSADFAETDLIKEASTLPVKPCDCEEVTSACYSMLKNVEDDQQSAAKEKAECKQMLLKLQSENSEMHSKVIALNKTISERKEIAVERREFQEPVVARVVNVKRESALEHLRAKLFEDLESLQQTIRERDQLAEKYHQSPKRKQLKVNVYSFKAGSDLSPGSLRKDLQEANSFSFLGQVQKNMLQVKKSVQDDIKLLERIMSKG